MKSEFTCCKRATFVSDVITFHYGVLFIFDIFLFQSATRFIPNCEQVLSQIATVQPENKPLDRKQKSIDIYMLQLIFFV